MRLPRFRFTVRRMMIAVAIVGVTIGVLAVRRSAFLRRADHYHRVSRSYIALQLPTPPGEFPDASYWRQIIWAGKMRAKYERAARYPWLPVAPDPPELK